MFGYNYGIQKDEKGNKIINISVSLDYLIKSGNYKDELTSDTIDSILNLYNPIGILRDEIEKIYYNEWR